MSDQEVYERLIDWLRQSWVLLRDSEELLPMVMARCTPEEAELVTGMPYGGQPLEELAELKGMDPAELGPRLDALARKGVVYRDTTGEVVRYRLNDAFFTYMRSSYWAGHTDEATKSIASHMNKYFHEGFYDDNFAGTETMGLRSLPIKGTIEDTRQIMPYEDVVKVLEAEDFFCVGNCPCRHRKNLDPDWPDCKHPVENCLHFGPLAHYMVEQGMGREISHEEANEILLKAADAGLVHGLSNMQTGGDTICNCCKCCCLMFEGYHVLHSHSGSVTPSNYVVAITTETCLGCGLCVKRCPMDALRLEESPEVQNKTGKISVLTAELCIGCGVCAHKCPSKSLVLERKEVTTDPPKDQREFAMRIMTERQAAQAKVEQEGGGE